MSLTPALIVGNAFQISLNNLDSTTGELEMKVKRCID